MAAKIFSRNTGVSLNFGRFAEDVASYADSNVVSGHH